MIVLHGRSWACRMSRCDGSSRTPRRSSAAWMRGALTSPRGRTAITRSRHPHRGFMRLPGLHDYGAAFSCLFHAAKGIRWRRRSLRSDQRRMTPAKPSASDLVRLCAGLDVREQQQDRQPRRRVGAEVGGVPGAYIDHRDESVDADDLSHSQRLRLRRRWWLSGTQAPPEGSSLSHRARPHRRHQNSLPEQHKDVLGSHPGLGRASAEKERVCDANGSLPHTHELRGAAPVDCR